MKKTIRNITVIILAAITIFSIFLVVAREKEQYYSKAGCVVEVDTENDLVYVDDFAGNEWSFYGCEDWEVNDVVSMKMYTNRTVTIFDDEIVTVNYEGWLK